MRDKTEAHSADRTDKTVMISACHTDIGLKKSVNQDSLLLMQARDTHSSEEITFAVLCDGVGGMKKGEVASAAVVMAFQKWFVDVLPEYMSRPWPNTEITFEEGIAVEWMRLIQALHERLKELSQAEGIRLGTTADILLLIDSRYYIGHVGDSRTYFFADELVQMTKDHSVIQQELDNGRITAAQAAHDSRQSLLLQCIGAGKAVRPDFLSGTFGAGQMFLLCCDGFRRRITSGEIEKRLAKARRGKESELEFALEDLTETCKKRRERDNISAILIRTEKYKKTPLLDLLNLNLAAEKQAEPVTAGRLEITKNTLMVHTDELVDGIDV